MESSNKIRARGQLGSGAGLLLLLVALCLLFSACTGRAYVVDQLTDEEKAVQNITAALDSAEDMATQYEQVPMVERKVTVMLEGYSDEASMMALADYFAKRDLPVLFCLSGAEVLDHPAVAEYINEKGLAIGNYTLSGEKNMQNNSAEKNARQFYKTQQIIFQATGNYPTILRCNGSEYTEEMLKLASLCDLKATVTPTVYLNHTSFSEEANALNFVRKLERGSIISIKLGQVLDKTEYQNKNEELDERPTVDPKPMQEPVEINEDDSAREYENLISIASWLVKALQQEKYQIVAVQDLAKYGISMNDDPQTLDPETEATLDAALYPNLVTEQPFGVQETAAAADSYFDNAVFVGDSIMVKIADYVAEMRQSNPDYLGNAQFLAATGLSVGNSLWQVSAESRHPVYNGESMTIEDAVALMKADKVYICLGLNDIALYDVAAYINNYKTLIYLIRSKSPGAEIYIGSITPGIAGRADNETSNASIFAYDLALVRFCLEYGYEYIDTAFVLRDEQGNLPASFCSDPDDMGVHFTEAGCQAWLDYVRTHIPSNK